MKKIIALCCIAALFASCQNKEQKPTEETETMTSRHPEWAKNANIYEVNIRQATAEGTFAAFEGHLERLKNMGVDILWIMPIQPIGKVNRKGGMGSYYAISNYREVNPDYGTLEDFDRLVKKAHELGMKVILDWVANHTAFDHHWVQERPDFYTPDADGKSPTVALDNEGKPTDWTDVADLDYKNEDMIGAMTESMRYWLVAANVDGFRCDVAFFVPEDLWKYAEYQLKLTKADIFLLAEAEDPKLMKYFNMDYGWELHHLMNEVAQGKKPASVFSDYLKKQNETYGPDDIKMFFTSNHDENSWKGTEFERMGPAHQSLFVLASTFQNGMPLIYNGQEASLNKRLRFFDKDTITWENQELVPFYSSMLKLKHENPALWNGVHGGKQVEIPTAYPREIYAYYREKNGNRVVTLLNFSDKKLLVENLPKELYGSYNSLKGSSVTLNDKASITLEPYGYGVLTQQQK